VIKEPKISLEMRALIVLYELGDVARALVYGLRFPSESNAHRAELKLAVADLYMMVRKLISDLPWSEEEIRQLGEQRLRQKYEEFEKRGWV